MNHLWCILHCYIVAGNLLNSKPCCIFCYSTVLKIATARFFATAQFSKLLRHGFLLRHSFQNCYSTLFCYGTVLKIATAQFSRFFSALVLWSDLICGFFMISCWGILNQNGQKFGSVNNQFHEKASRLLYNNVNTQLRSCLRSWKYGSLVPNLASLVALRADS